MNQIQTGQLIRQLRLARRMTQRTLAERIGVTDKAVSKWERGCGVPDVETLPILADVLQADVKALLSGSLDEAKSASGNLRRVCFFVCPVCGNVVAAAAPASICCCGRKVQALKPQRLSDAERLNAVRDDGEWYITSPHEMTRSHHIRFLAAVSTDTVYLRHLYPEWTLETRLPMLPHAKLVWYCTKHGLFEQPLG